MKSAKILSGGRRIVLAVGTLGLLGAFATLLPVAAQAAGANQSGDVWAASLMQKGAPAAGCFEALPGATGWTSVACGSPVVKASTPPPPVNAASVAKPKAGYVGSGNDYIATTTSTFTGVIGSFPSVTGVKTVSSGPNANFPGSADSTTRANAYGLQLNSNTSTSPTACAKFGYQSCHVWDQFIYDPKLIVNINDVFAGFNNAQIYIQNWVFPSLADYTAKGCPSGWMDATAALKLDPSKGPFGGAGQCMMNSWSIPVTAATGTDSFKQQLAGSASANGLDIVYYWNGSKLFAMAQPDSTLGLSGWWNQAEFIVCGDGGGTIANFNDGSSATVRITVGTADGSAPSWALGGTTGEANNLTLGAAPKVVPATKTLADVISAGSINLFPYIEFTASN